MVYEKSCEVFTSKHMAIHLQLDRKSAAVMGKHQDHRLNGTGRPAHFSASGGFDLADFLRGKDKGKDLCDGEVARKSCLMVPKEEGSEERVLMRKAKSVHFADTCGLALTSVLPLFDCDDEFVSTLRNGFRNFSKSGRSSPNFSNFTRPTRPLGDSERKSQLLNFVQPVTLANFQERVETQCVCLENIVFREFSIFGTVVVRNMAFDKKVTVRFTVDGWQSVHDVATCYVNDSHTGRTDTFSFEIIVPGGDESEVKLEFAVFFETLGQTFWDNNFGDNYRVLYHRKSRPLHNGKMKRDGFLLGRTGNQFNGWTL